MRIQTIIAAVSLAALLSCASGSSVITGETRDPISPDEVRIYLEPPERFEVIGLLEVTSNVNFSRQKAQDRAMQRLKEQAAKVGANGVLLHNTQVQVHGGGGASGFGMGTGSSGNVSYGGMFIIGSGSGSSDRISAQGRAIYVPPAERE